MKTCGGVDVVYSPQYTKYPTWYCITDDLAPKRGAIGKSDSYGGGDEIETCDGIDVVSTDRSRSTVDHMRRTNTI